MDYKKESEMFNQAADYYDRYRPSYPSEIIDMLTKETGIEAGSRLIEIGAGSGKATELFVNRGYQILCIDPGEDLVRIGNERIQEEGIHFECGRFEEYELPSEYYDVIFSAQAFHWVPQPIGYQKCAFTLKQDAYLALFWNMRFSKDTGLVFIFSFRLLEYISFNIGSWNSR